MTITSVGYPGPIDAGKWAGLAASLGADYGVVGAGDLRVSTVPAADRTVKIAAGTGYGRGIMDVSSAEETIQLTSLGSGSRWDLVGLLRTWAGGSSATTITKVTGTSSQTAAFALRASTPGTSDFQPLALVQITAGNTVPTAVIDLRIWQANGGAVASDVLALQYLNGAGTEVWVGSDVWHRYVDGVGALQWMKTPSVAVRHAEVTGPSGGFPVANAILWGLGTQTLDTSASMDAPGVASGAGFSVAVAGLYAVTAFVKYTTTISARHLVQISVGSTIAARAVLTGDDQGSASVTGIRLAVGDLVVGTVYQASGSIQTVTSRLRVTLLRAA